MKLISMSGASRPASGNSDILRAALLAAALSPALAANANAGQQIFLNFPGIAGNATATNHVNEIVLNSVSLNASANTMPTASPGNSFQATCGLVAMTKVVDKTSPLFLALLFGATVTTGVATLTFEDTTQSPPYDYYKIAFSGIVVASISQSGQSAANDQEQITLRVGKISYSFLPKAQSGTAAPTPISFGWDCVNNVAVTAPLH